MSNDIKYVCLSDMHFGADNSLLTKLVSGSREVQPMEASEVMIKLVDCLRDLLGESKPTLILNGDILEMALNQTHTAAMVFQRFMELIMKKDEELFSDIVFIPGNHDHHLWELARETQYVKYITSIDDPDEELQEPWHISRMLPRQDKKHPMSYFLTELSLHTLDHLDKESFEIATAYPNYAVCDDKKERCVIFTHGHFFEKKYMLMSHMRNLIFEDQKMPDTVQDIEKENFAWIDFFWSAMGRSGKVGKQIDLIYSKIEDDDKEELRTLLHGMAKNLAKRYWSDGKWNDFKEEWLLKKVFDKIIDVIKKSEKKEHEKALSDDTYKCLKDYLEVPLYKQLSEELKKIEPTNAKPTEISLVFGHTHKPFAKDYKDFDKYPKWINAFNTGGWVVDTEEPEILHGGAIVVVDDEYNVVLIRMYNEAKKGEEFKKVHIEDFSHPNERENLLVEYLNEKIGQDKDQWDSFSDSVEKMLPIMHENTQEKKDQMR